MKMLTVFGAEYLDLIKLVDEVNRSFPTCGFLGFLGDARNLRGTSFSIRGLIHRSFYGNLHPAFSAEIR